MNAVAGENTVQQSDYGALTLIRGIWTYRLDNDREATNALAAGDSEEEVFEFRAWDGTAASEVVMLVITVNGTNDAPMAVSPLPTVRTAVAGSAYSYDLNNLFEDPEGDDPTFTVSTGTCTGFAIDPATTWSAATRAASCPRARQRGT